MKLSTRGRYGTRILLDLAQHQGDNPIPLKDIARRQNLSLSYLERLITPLTSAGIIRSTRGPRGGISLMESPQDIKISSIIRLLEGSLSPSDCVNNPCVCSRSSTCAARNLWEDVDRAITSVLESWTLQDLVKTQNEKEHHSAEMYHI
ncbi:MAG: Rrf2 family transcriptional regulator [Dehalococcoidia bacterium]|nr:Rrf2 family transcriptional regulator [Dehalococcoidia bacterium]